MRWRPGAALLAIKAPSTPLQIIGARVRVPPQAHRVPGIETALPTAPFALSCGLRLPADAATVIYCAVHQRSG